jgi:hypothetical protein
MAAFASAASNGRLPRIRLKARYRKRVAEPVNLSAYMAREMLFGPLRLPCNGDSKITNRRNARAPAELS